MSHKVMGKAGHFGKTLTMLARNVSLSTTVSDCGTKHLVKYHVNDNNFLRKLDLKYYTLNPNDPYSLKLLHADKCKDLVGKDIYVRSAVTCALENHICPVCFGRTANFNLDIADGIAAYFSEEIAKVIEQNILSTKHLLTTTSESIKFNPELNMFFNIVSDEIDPIITDTEIEDLNDWVIKVDETTINKVDAMDAEEGYNSYINNGTFEVINIKTGQFYRMEEKNHKELYLTDDFIELKRKGKGVVRFKDLDDDTVLFTMDIANNELTKPLYELMHIINSDKGSVERTINDVSQKFVELLVESKIDAPAVAGEIIINRLIRKDDNVFERPDFSSNVMPKYKIVTIMKALEKNKSPLVGISYQYLKRQLLSDDTVEMKNAPSYLDPFFKKKVSTKKIKMHYLKTHK